MNPESQLTFNHAMVYSHDVAAALRFYSGLLGFEVLEELSLRSRDSRSIFRTPVPDDMHVM